MKLTVSEARFLIVTRIGRQKGQMLFWNEDAQNVEQLALGKVYRFSALMETSNEGILMFYVPNHTKFDELTPEEMKNVEF